MFRQVGVLHGAGCEIVAAITPLSRGWVNEFALWAVHCLHILIALRSPRPVVSEKSIAVFWAILKDRCSPTGSEMYPCSASINSA